MDYKNDWEKSKERLLALWEGEIVDRCSVSVTAPKQGSNYKPVLLPDDPEEKFKCWTDGEWVLKRYLNYFENTYFGGEAFPQVFLYLGAAGHAGYFKNVRYQVESTTPNGTLWFFPSILDWEKDTLEFDPNSILYKKTLEMARYFVSESKGRYFVSQPDISGNADALAHLRGSENLLVDMVLEQERIEEELKKIQQVWLKVSEEIYDITNRNNEGGSTIGWLNTWSPGRHAQMQCDLSVMISPALFNKLMMPELINQSEWMDNALYHFDGVDQTKHLDSLLSIKNLKVIQWTCVAGQPSPLEFIPTLKRIQADGKGLLIIIKPEELEPLMEQLSSKGLYLQLSVSSEDEAREVIKKVERLTHE